MYQGFQPSQQKLAAVRETVIVELRAQSADALDNADRARKRHQALLDERAKLMQAHYQGAVPVDLLRSEMERLTRAIADAEAQIRAAATGLDEIELTLNRALGIAEHCQELYEAATPAIRRQINQGFFKALYIGPDGDVERSELTEPFAQLLGAPVQATTASTADDRCRPSAVLTSSFDLQDNTAPDIDLVRRGVKAAHLVDQTWQNKNRVFAVQGPDVAVQAVRRRLVSVG